MRNIWKLFRSDLRRLFSNVVTGIIVLGLVTLPSIFSWYNILACWDVFDNTGNLKVAVANTDEGYESDLVAIRVNIGESVVSALRGNDQLDWVVTDEEDAVDGTMSGKYYAAVVIPPTFSADMLTFYEDNAERADIVYYTNEKRGAIAPKITDQGADRVAYQVNETFTETLTQVALSLIESLSDYLDKADAQNRVATLASHLQLAGKQLDQTSSAIRSYTQVVSSSKALVKSSSNLIGQTKSAVDEMVDATSQSKESLRPVADAFSETSASFAKAVSQTKGYYDALPDKIDEAYSQANTLSTDSVAALRSELSVIDDNTAAMRNARAQLASIESLVPAEQKAAIQAAEKSLDQAIGQQESLGAKISEAADNLEKDNADIQADHEEAKALAQKAQENMATLATTYDTDIKPRMDELSGEFGQLADSLKSSAESLQKTTDSVKISAQTVGDDLDNATGKLNGIADKLSASSSDLERISAGILDALDHNDMEAVRDLVSADSESLAAALAAPVALDRHEVFPADNFGSQMAPLYTMLALWIGSLLLSVCIRVTVPQEDVDKLDRPKHYQLFLGHFGVFALISLMQTTCLAVGNMAFLGLQVNEPLLYLLCFWVSGLVFAFIIYALVAAFANLGKAIAVLMLIIQVTGCNGAFPLQLLPTFIQKLSIWLPGTHTISAMRAAMFGVYANDYWIAMGKLLTFVIPAALIGLVLCKQLSKFMDWYIKRVDSSKLVA